jgi:hypothetical protein
VLDIKNDYLRKTEPVSKIAFDSKVKKQLVQLTGGTVLPIRGGVKRKST